MPTYTPLPTNVTELKKALCAGAATPAERQKCARFAKQLALVHRDFNLLSAAVTRLNTDEQALAQQAKEVSSGVSLQYLELQQKLQRDNREVALIRNIMKSKHDTVKNTINNVR